MLFYAAGVLDIHLDAFFYSLRFYRELAADTDDWDAVAPRLTGTALSETNEWLSLSINNAAVPLITPETAAPTTEIYVDASAWGYGATVRTAGAYFSISRPWSAAQHAAYNLHSSVVAEPLAVELVVKEVCSSHHPHSVLIWTDHRPIVFAAARGYAACLCYNRMLSALRTCFPAFSFAFAFVPGISNPADHLSRGWQKEQGEYLVGSMGLRDWAPSVRFPRLVRVG